jgi:hypothetical protein
MITQECQFCAEFSPVSEMCGPVCASSCNSKSCRRCLRKYIRMKEQEGVYPTCPEERCSAPIDGFILMELFKDHCLLCEGRKVCPLISVGCALNHSYCEPCLQQSTVQQLNCCKELPRCPRSVECKFEYNQESMQSILHNREDVEDLILQWHERRVSLSQSAHPLYRPCPAPDCSGQLIANIDIHRSSLPSKVECYKCRITFCWRCGEPSHGNTTCLEIKDTIEKWAIFLQQLIGVHIDEGLVGGNSVEDIAGIVAAFTKLEQVMANNLYFKENFELGNLKHCPSCQRLIEKLGGCESMICGQDHDGGVSSRHFFLFICCM